jgi:hypothetical protein
MRSTKIQTYLEISENRDDSDTQNNIGRNKAKEQKLGKYDVPQKPGINEICHEVYNPQSQLKIQRFLHLGGGGIHF